MEEKKDEKQLNSTVEEELDISFLHDITLKLTGEVGRTTKNFIDILRLKEGDIIKLDKHIEDYLEIYLRGQLFAIGELVVVNEKYAIRVVDLA
ncbi:flagellar motor switch protein FliN/FliY [Persephonella hydrogeniphila]|uniref:Flagellar motor switch protein FliN n=1 Tax=Persephonella hydrogeniphila TaxID=198703 RepID=A0A285NF48_9AQUI|nr:FliM/FliN family flagellar motor switch protein [Persephonella hydrogeniphila]SNZ08090.1 flagellar motor switch protein FliN/FliY [Persephonella hydrogeniphila]